MTVGFVHKSYTISDTRDYAHICATATGGEGEFEIDIVTESKTGM